MGGDLCALRGGASYCGAAPAVVQNKLYESVAEKVKSERCTLQGRAHPHEIYPYPYTFSSNHHTHVQSFAPLRSHTNLATGRVK